MYIIEKIIKLYIKLCHNEEKPAPVLEYKDNYVLEDVLTCRHNFLPIDSTQKYFACTKCGYLVRKERLRRKKKPE